MKKIIKLILKLFIIFLIFEFIIYIFKDNHEIKYKIKENKETYKIEETYKNDKYYIKIKQKENTYVFDVNNDFNKKKEIVKKIHTYKKDNLNCIYPVLTKKEEKTNIICSENKETKSLETVKDEIKPFIEKLQKKGYESPSWDKKSNKTKKLDSLKIYQQNIPDETYIYIYKYNGFYSINKKDLEKINLFKNDSYNNHLGTQVGRYYVIPNYDQKYDYRELYRIDMKKNKVKTIKLKEKISKDSFINGVIDNELYLFDKDELIQYKINPKKKKVEEIGNKKDKVLTYNLKFKRINVYTMRDEETKFKTTDDYINKLEKTKEIKYIEKNNNTYFYQTDDDNIYYYNDITKTKVFIINKKITDFKLINETIYFISEDTLYSYDFINGLNKLIIYSELSFNSNNRIAIYTE